MSKMTINVLSWAGHASRLQLTLMVDGVTKLTRAFLKLLLSFLFAQKSAFPLLLIPFLILLVSFLLVLMLVLFLLAVFRTLMLVHVKCVNLLSFPTSNELVRLLCLV